MKIYPNQFLSEISNDKAWDSMLAQEKDYYEELSQKMEHLVGQGEGANQQDVEKILTEYEALLGKYNIQMDYTEEEDDMTFIEDVKQSWKLTLILIVLSLLLYVVIIYMQMGWQGINDIDSITRDLFFNVIDSTFNK